MVDLQTITKMFGPTRSRIFAFVFDNIYCTREEIELAIYGRVLRDQNKVVAVHLCGIKRMLDRWTDFQLVSNPSRDLAPRRGKPRYVYKITLKPPVRTEKTAPTTPTEGEANVTT